MKLELINEIEKFQMILKKIYKKKAEDLFTTEHGFPKLMNLVN